MTLDRNTASLDTSRCNVLDSEVRSKQACRALPGTECGGNKAQPHVAVRHFDPGFPNRRGSSRGRGASAGTSWLSCQERGSSGCNPRGHCRLGLLAVDASLESPCIRTETTPLALPRDCGGEGEKQTHLSVCRYPRRLVRRRAVSCFWVLV